MREGTTRQEKGERKIGGEKREEEEESGHSSPGGDPSLTNII